MFMEIFCLSKKGIFQKTACPKDKQDRSWLSVMLTYITVGWGREKLSDLAAMETECVQLGARIDIPQTDGEIHAAWDEVLRLVTTTVVERVQQARDLAIVTLKNLLPHKNWNVMYEWYKHI